MGRHLLEMGMAPGPQMGEIVKAVYFAQLAGEVDDVGRSQSARGQVVNPYKSRRDADLSRLNRKFAAFSMF